jgi:hypothetical protein
MAQINEISDHGIECLKKSAIVPNDKKPAQYALRIRSEDIEQKYNSVQIAVTTITTVATKVNTPENCSSFFIEHQESGETLYIGDSSVTSLLGYPLKADKSLDFNNFYKNDNNEIYGICAGSIVVYCVGVYKQ